MKVNFICDYCGGEGQKRPQHLNENKRLGHRNYCSRACMAKDRTHTLHTECGSCGVSVEKSLAQVKRSKSGKVFCSRSCACSYNNKHLKFGANHPNYDGGRSSYRERALRELGVKTEFLGRVGLIYNLSKLSIDSMRAALVNSKLLENYLKLFPKAKRDKCIEDIMVQVEKTFEQNTLGIRVINTLLHQYFINGGKVTEDKVNNTTFT